MEDQGAQGQEDAPAPEREEREAEPAPEETSTRSGCLSRPTRRWAESLAQQEEGIVSLYVSWEVFHDGGYQVHDDMEDPIAFAASSNPDIMYLDQAMKEPDSQQFKKA
jgi:hypothetical protein